MQLLTDRRMIGASIPCIAVFATSLAIAQIRGQPPRPINPTPICPVQTGAGTVHSSNINAGSVESWGPTNGSHIVSGDISIYGLLTIEPCTVVQIAAGKSITVYSGGTLLVSGTPVGKVSISNIVGGALWASIRNLGGTLSLSHAYIWGGGATQSSNLAYTATLEMRSNTANARFHVDNVEIGDSASQGVYVAGAVGFDSTSVNLRIRNCAYYPIHVYARVIGSIPTGSYAENKRAAIAIAGLAVGGTPVLDAQTMHNRGIPYHVGSGTDGGRMDVNSQNPNSVAVLTIEPGVMIQFPPGGSLKIDPTGGSNTAAARGALVALGTQSAPIIFTSDRGSAAAAGDWVGVTFGGTVNPQTKMQLVRVEYAGGAEIGGNSCPVAGRGQGENFAAIRIYGPPLSQTPFVTDSIIFASALDGIDRAWNANVLPDFKAVNSFAAVPGCLQSIPRNPLALCPTSLTCP